MTLYEFNSFDEQEQAEAVWSAIHRGERRDSEHNVRTLEFVVGLAGKESV
ncbi:hypothetical protein [Ginsengibacter hankyongi]|nr:hypothetical protein [Ginsengibacter hankyongi]